MEKTKPAFELPGAQHWDIMTVTISSGTEFRRIQLGNGYEFRFVPMVDGSFSALLSQNNIDVFHFMWTEVEGLVNITHRIVNPKFRGHGIGARVMQALDKRLEQLCDHDQLPYHLMMETSQLSVIGLGKKIGMVLTAGGDIFDSIQSGDSSYQIDENTHVTDANNYRMLFRVSKAYPPEAQVISIRQGEVRENIYALAA